MTFDAARRTVVLFGGLHQETWEFGPAIPADYVPLGAGCAGAAGTPALAAQPYSYPWIGSRLGVTVKAAHRNRSSRGDYRRYYSDDTAALVARIYAADIVLTGARFDDGDRSVRS